VAHHLAQAVGAAVPAAATGRPRARESGEELERQLAALTQEMRRDERRTMGAISSGERDRIREELRRQSKKTR
jgi:hypothetical protein